jgi:VWFA-related protein
VQSSGNLKTIEKPMLNVRVSLWIRRALCGVLLITAANFAFSQNQKLPDAPTPQNNAPAPTVTAPPETSPDDQGSSTSKGNPEQPSNTRQTGQQPQPQSPGSNPPPPGSREVKTVPAGSVAPGSNAQDQLLTLSVQVNFITVPVTVKDSEGKLVDGLLQNDFSVYENGAKQQIRFFTSDPLPLSAAVVIDLNLPEIALKKINRTYSALGGAFGPFDDVALFTYGNSVSKQQDFGSVQRLDLALNRVRDIPGQNSNVQTVGGPFGSGPTNNGIPVDPGRLPVQTPTRESYVLNDAILTAAQELAHRPRENRKIIFVISDGKEYGSRANYAQVLKVLLTNQVAVYAVGVDSAAMPVVNTVSKVRIPGFGYSDILPKYANATGGDVLNEFSKDSIESAYQRITLEARNQYTLGYNTPQTASSTYRDIEVRVKRPGVNVYAKHGYYPLPPQRAPELQPDQGKAGTPDQPPQQPQPQAPQ